MLRGWRAFLRGLLVWIKIHTTVSCGTCSTRTSARVASWPESFSSRLARVDLKSTLRRSVELVPREGHARRFVGTPLLRGRHVWIEIHTTVWRGTCSTRTKIRGAPWLEKCFSLLWRRCGPAEFQRRAVREPGFTTPHHLPPQGKTAEGAVLQVQPRRARPRRTAQRQLARRNVPASRSRPRSRDARGISSFPRLLHPEPGDPQSVARDVSPRKVNHQQAVLEHLGSQHGNPNHRIADPMWKAASYPTRMTNGV